MDPNSSDLSNKIRQELRGSLTDQKRTIDLETRLQQLQMDHHRLQQTHDIACKQLSEKEMMRDQQQKMNDRLGEVNAKSAELMLELEDKNAHLQNMNQELARANAHSAELMALLELKNDKIESLNRELSGANARAGDLLAELEISLEKLKLSQEQLRLMNVTKDRFFSIIAHDLRNPFTTLLATTSLMEKRFDEIPEEDKREYISGMRRACKTTHQLLENLLQWAQSQLHGIQYKPERLILNTLANDTFTTIADMAAGKQISLQTGIPPEIVVMADKNMLQSVLRNLLTNAIKFTPPGGKITITAGVRDQTVEVAVADSGIGMPEQIRSNIFNLSKNVSRRGTEAEKGTGLGLLLCKEFMDKHGGNIRVESEEGKGTQFILNIPGCTDGDS